uniref:Vetispiradiene synthase 5 n=1 Tax=Solanum tuberosum TaxID=4113 RepID=M1A3Y3_SOLTU
MTSLAGNVNNENGIFRLEANFSPSLWGNIFSNSTRNNQIISTNSRTTMENSRKL